MLDEHARDVAATVPLPHDILEAKWGARDKQAPEAAVHQPKLSGIEPLVARLDQPAVLALNPI